MAITIDFYSENINIYLIIRLTIISTLYSQTCLM